MAIFMSRCVPLLYYSRRCSGRVEPDACKSTVSSRLMSCRISKARSPLSVPSSKALLADLLLSPPQMEREALGD